MRQVKVIKADGSEATVNLKRLAVASAEAAKPAEAPPEQPAGEPATDAV
jgi:hypothetical protein